MCTEMSSPKFAVEIARKHWRTSCWIGGWKLDKRAFVPPACLASFPECCSIFHDLCSCFAGRVKRKNMRKGQGGAGDEEEDED